MKRYIVDVIGPTPESETGRRYVVETDPEEAARRARDGLLDVMTITFLGATVFQTIDGYIVIVRELES